MTRSTSLLATLLLAPTLLAGCQQGELVEAAEGGSVTSDDGVLTLIFPPGSLPSDTYISIDPIAEASWPVGAPGRFERIGDVYQVQPAGLELVEDAYAVLIPPSRDALTTSSGEDLFAVHYVYSPTEEKVRPAPSSRNIHLADGRIAIVGTLYDLGMHWVGGAVPGADRALPVLSARVVAEAGAHDAGSSFSASELSLTSDLEHLLFDRTVRSAVVASGSASPIEPLVPVGSTMRTWDATIDPELGMHPYQVFGLGSGARTELFATQTDLEPIEMVADEPLSPVLDTLPGWSCTGSGTGEVSLFVEVDVVTGASEGVVHVSSAREIGAASCR